MKFRHGGTEAMWLQMRPAWYGALALLAILLQGSTMADAAITQGATSLRRGKTPPQKHLQTDKMAAEKDDEEAQDDDGDEDDGDEDAEVVPAAAGTATSTPAAVSLGPGGYPELPSIAKLFESATKTLKVVASQAHMLEERAVAAGKKDEARLAHRKSVYERKLKRQERENRVVEKAVSKASARIQALRLNNAAIKNHSLSLRKSNHLMREELKAIQKRLQTSQEFVGKSLATTDDSNAKELDVLKDAEQVGDAEESAEEADTDDSDVDDDADAEDQDDADDNTATTGQSRQAQTSSAPVFPSVPPPVLQAQLHTPAKPLVAMQQTVQTGKDDSDEDEDGDDDESDEDEDGNETGTSFLALRAKRQASKAETALAATAGRDILAEISSNVKALAVEEKKSQQNLQAFFEAAWQAGERRHEALEAHLASLNATEVSLLQYQDKLKAAEAHLRTTQGQLEAHLHAQGLFTQRLAHLALAPAVEAPRLLEAVPDHVTLSKDAPGKAKKVALTGMMPTIVDNTPP